MSSRPTSSSGSAGQDKAQPLTYRANEFPRHEMFVPGVGIVSATGMDAEVLAEIKAAGLWSSFRSHMKIGQTIGTVYRHREGDRVSLFLFVGDAQQGGFMSMTAQDSPRAREVMLNTAHFFTGRPVRIELREGGGP